jgi:hypothetical protein
VDWFKKKVPDVGVTHRGSTDNKLGGGLITKYNFKSGVKIISRNLNANNFVIIKRFFFIKELNIF